MQRNIGLPLSRRRLLQLTAASGVGAALVACSLVGTDDSDPSQPTRGGTLRVGRTSDILTLDPAGAAIAEQQGIYVAQVFDNLIRYDADGELVPHLAESFELSADGLELTLVLRQGVQFHNGREFTADDVEWNILRLREAEVTPFYKSGSKAITGVHKEDAYTVRLIQAEPSAELLNLLRSLYIANPETLEGPDAANTAVGTGPFTLEEWSPGSRLRLARFDGYWQEDLPYLDEIDVQVVADAPALAVQLESGQVDLAQGVALRDSVRLSDSGFTLVEDVAPNTLCFILNTAVAPLDDKRVRQAINYAINRERVAKTLLAGIGRPTSVIWPPASPAYTEESASTFTFDLERAKSLLDEAGVPDIDLPVQVHGGYPIMADVAEILRADLATVGITLQTQILEPAAFAEQILKPVLGGNAEAYKGMIAIPVGGPVDPGITLSQAVFLSANPTRNVANFSSDRYTELGVTALDVSLGDEARFAAVREATEIMLDESFILPVAYDVTVLVSSQDVSGVEYILQPLLVQASVLP